ncbi:MAG TPA: FAD-linked oxidase C-terminal domain-containing protein [Chloroflexota bacterium]
MDTARLASELRALVGDAQVVAEPVELQVYSYDASFLAQISPRAPQVVVRPRHTEDIRRVVAFAFEHGVPVTPRGSATGQTGGCVPVRGGIVITLNHLNRIVELDAENLQVIVEPGVVHANLNEFLAPYNLIFPPDPGSSRMCSVGGMASNNAHGMRAVKYGPTSHWVLGLEVVLPDGRVIETGSRNSRALQSSAGLELTKLFVGAEGILGIITRLRLKLMPKPRARGIVLAIYDQLERCAESVVATFRAGILPSAIEILDQSAIRAVNIYRPQLRLPEQEAMLLFEVDGNPAGVAEDARAIAEIVRPYAVGVEWADEPRRVATLWEARAVVGAATGALRPGAMRAYTGEDIAVPLKRMPEALRAVRNIAEKHRLTIATYGHVSSGGIHAGLLIDPHDPDEVRRVLEASDEIHRLALDLGGTTTGEHGVGVVRAAYMPQEHGPALDVMWEIKQALDPKGIMNPGKVFPEGYRPARLGGVGAAIAASLASS